MQFPVGREEQQEWLLRSLLHSTRGFAKPGVAQRVCDEVQALLTTMVAGKEAFEVRFKEVRFSRLRSLPTGWSGVRR